MKIPFTRKLTQGVRTLTCSVAIAAIAAPGFAADSWLSQVRIVDSSGSKSRLTMQTPADEVARMLSARTSTTAVFDIVISLEDNPQGDDDASVDAGASDADQRAYEDRIEEFANAVFQATNGAHKIGRVTVYRDFAQRNLADVQWETNCASDNGPWAMAGGYLQSGKYIHFCTNWPGASSLMPTPRGSGYTLAHEWGHYAYNIYDEYAANQCQINLGTLFGLTCPKWQPRSSDVESPTIMNDQWSAAVGGPNTARFLEFSTANVAPYNASTGSNGQSRYFGESAWETMTRDPATDPKYPDLDRTQYTNLTAPTAPNFLVVGSIADAQSDLDIRWVGDQVVELMIDRSGSMSGSPIANARTGASLLIGQLPEGQSAIGVGSFSSSVTQNYPITDIPDPDTGVRNDAIAAVNSLSASGLTALYDGLLLALNEANAFQAANATSRETVVYVLSDGFDNSSSASEADVIAAYQAAGVPIVAFGYGSGAPTGTLAAMANATGGLFLQSPTTVSEIQNALLTANAAFSNNVLVSTSDVVSTASGATTLDVEIDSSLADVTINASWNGNETDGTLRLLDPAGADTGVAFTCSGNVSCTAALDSTVLSAGGPGTYVVEFTNATMSDIDLSVLVAGTPSAGAGYDIVTGFVAGNTVAYPAPMLLTTSVRSGLPITGLTVEVDVVAPGGAESTLTMVDDGTGGDAIADDGLYTVAFPYTSNGVHEFTVRVSNADGTAVTASQGLSVAAAVDGSVTVPPPVAITENFTRTASTTASVQGSQPDDHTNDPAVPAFCTPVADDNVDTVGRVDAAGDVDCFFFTPSSTSTDLRVRATRLIGGMEPQVTVYDANGTTQLLQATLATSENDAVGVVATIPASALAAEGHVITVQHASAAADTGGYEVSLGPVLASDAPAPGDPDDPAPTGSGGAMGPWSILALALLALVGLRQRRKLT